MDQVLALSLLALILGTLDIMNFYFTAAADARRNLRLRI